MNQIIHNVGYLPLPNTVEIVLTDELAPAALTTTAFAVAVSKDNGDVLLANNVRRGPEIAGGHIEPGETELQAARREAKEETGASLGRMIPIGYLKMVSEGEVPDDHPYPHPVSYQQFFAARITTRDPYVANDECGEPVTLTMDDPLPESPSKRAFIERARSIICDPAMVD